MNRRTMLTGLGASLIPTVGAVSGTPISDGGNTTGGGNNTTAPTPEVGYENPEITFYGKETDDETDMVRVYLTLELNGYDVYRATYYVPPRAPWQEQRAGFFNQDVTMKYIGKFDRNAKFMGTLIGGSGERRRKHAPLRNIQMISNDDCHDPTPVEPHEYQERPQIGDDTPERCDGGGGGSDEPRPKPIEPHGDDNGTDSDNEPDQKPIKPHGDDDDDGSGQTPDEPHGGGFDPNPMPFTPRN